MSFLHKKRNYILSLQIITFLCCITLAQIYYDRERPPFTTKLPKVERHLIPAKILPYTHFGFKTFLGDLYWIRAVQDFPSWDAKNPFFLNYFTNISTLDPRFEYPYLFAIFTIPQNKNIETLHKIARIADLGITEIPTSWKIPFYLGTQYFLFTKDYKEAERYLEIASKKEDAPQAVYLMYTNFVVNNIKGHRASRELLRTIYDTTDSSTIKKIVEKGLQEDILNQMMDSAILAYKVKYGEYPSSLNNLITNRFISLPNDFTDFFTVTINSRTGSYKIQEK